MEPKKRLRLIRYPGLGEFFISLRVTQKGWSQKQAGDRAYDRGYPVTYQAIRGLERGETKHISPSRLRAIAQLYGVAYEPLAVRVVQELYDLKKFAVGVQKSTARAKGQQVGSPLPGAHADVDSLKARLSAAYARIDALEQAAREADAHDKQITAELALRRRLLARLTPHPTATGKPRTSRAGGRGDL